MNYIQEYYEKINNGNIIVCNKLKKQIEKLIYDIEHQDEFVFDVKRANRPIEFIEKFCKHSKGKWLGQSIKLQLWQKMIIQAVFGFIDKEGNRRYREALIVVGRKNGKSLLLSAIGNYMLLADGEGGSQVCCVASKKDQAKIVFNESKNMVSQSPMLSKYIKKRKSDLYVPLTFSTFEPLASDSNTLDGLNAHCGIVDELHTLKDRNIYDVTKQSMSSRQQPLLFMITTAGFVRENIYDSMYEYADNVRDGIVDDKRFISFIYELDERAEWTDFKQWEKANPGLGIIKSAETLAELVERGKNDSSFLPTLLTKEFNIRENTNDSWLNFEDINNTDTYELKDFNGTYAIGGADLSSTTDLTCATLFWIKAGKKYVNQMYFIPKETAEKKEQEDKVPYKIWEEKGYVTFCEGQRVDYADVTKWFIDMREQYGFYPLWVGYDNWNANYWISEMTNNAFVMENVIQGAKTMSSPMKILASDFKSREINYNNNPVLKWCLTNTKVEIDKNDNIRPVKGKSQKQRIDGTVSLIDAYVVYERFIEDYTNMIKEE